MQQAFYGVRSVLAGGSVLSAADLAVLFAATAAARSGSYCGLAWGTRLAGHVGPGPAARVMGGATDGLDPRAAALADAQLAGAAPAEVRAAVSYGRPPAGTLSAQRSAVPLVCRHDLV